MPTPPGGRCPRPTPAGTCAGLYIASLRSCSQNRTGLKGDSIVDDATPTAVSISSCAASLLKPFTLVDCHMRARLTSAACRALRSPTRCPHSSPPLHRIAVVIISAIRLPPPLTGRLRSACLCAVLRRRLLRISSRRERSAVVVKAFPPKHAYRGHRPRSKRFSPLVPFIASALLRNVPSRRRPGGHSDW
eukprot:1460765-Prymnesium_polylepis.1